MTLRLHWSPDSANLVVRLALELLELPYEGARVNRGKGENKTPAYLEKNPQGLLPVLEDGALVLFETGAILWHLAEKTGRLGPDAPGADNPAARMTALKWLFFVSNTPHADLRAAFYTRRYVPAERIADLRAGIRRRFIAHADLIESQIPDGGLLGDCISLPDLYFCCCLRWARIYPPGEEILASIEPWPRLSALLQRVEAHPGAQKAFAAEHIPPGGALFTPRPPDLPRSEVTGTV